MMTLTRLTLAAIPLALLATCKTANKSKLEESWDDLNKPEIFQAKNFPYVVFSTADYLSGRLERQPWSDTYWPLFEAGSAARWIDPKKKFDLKVSASMTNTGSALDSKIDTAMLTAKENLGKTAEESATASPAEKIDLVLSRKDMPLVLMELKSYKTNSEDFKGIDWAWMGHCHGWAPASFMEQPPKNGVLLENKSGQTVFFSPGDIRGILTKAVADNGYEGNQLFMGTRCNDPAADIPRDSQKRVIDASVGIYQPGKYFSVAAPIRIQTNGWLGYDQLDANDSAVIGRFGPRYKNKNPLFWIQAASTVDSGKGIYGVRIYSTKMDGQTLVRDQVIVGRSESEVGTFVDSAGKPILEAGAPKKDVAAAKTIWAAALSSAPAKMRQAPQVDLAFKYWKECRDSNPGAFHLVLVNLLSKGGLGSKDPRSFVMDITRDDQVWNHPIYSFNSTMGTPTDLKIEGVKDPFKSWRAKGTVKIVDVYTKIQFGVENGPKLTYSNKDDQLEKMKLRYTLELDKDGLILGGEWHPVPESEWETESTPLAGKALLENLKKLAASKTQWESLAHPDFIWTPKPGSKIKDSKLIPATLIKKLQECSQKDADKQPFTINGEDIPTVRCVL